MFNTKTKRPKIQNLTFHNTLYNFIQLQPSLGVCVKSWEQMSCVLSDKMSFDFFLLYGPMVTKTEKNGKNPKFEILQIFIQVW